MEFAPEWLRELVADVASSTDALGEHAEIGCHVFQNDEATEWEVTLFAERPEWGGRLSQLSATPVLSVDVHAVVKVFDRVSACRWQTAPIPSGDDLGPHLSVEGEFAGHAVWLRVLGQKPAVLCGQESPLRFMPN
ncbi:MAG: hypothetical protein ACYTGL_26310 [Planctomycetota bacterium]|jgi:hypothetical protein